MTRPSIDPRWRDAFVLALRMRDLPPTAIADHLKLVETHCAESGEGAQEAFGDPADYADTLAPLPSERPRDLAALVPPAVVGLLAGSLLVEGVIGLTAGRPVEVTTGDLVAGAVLLVAALLAVTLLFRLRRPLLPTFAVAVGAVVLAVLLDLGLTTSVAELPAWLALVLALALLVGMVVATVRAAQDQRITDPVTGEPML